MARIGLKGLTYATLSGGGSGSACTYTGGATVADMLISADVTLTRDDVKLSADNHVVEGANGNMVTFYDVHGRVLATKRDEYAPLRFDAPASGTYLIKIGNYPARRVVVIR